MSTEKSVKPKVWLPAAARVKLLRIWSLTGGFFWNQVESRIGGQVKNQANSLKDNQL